MNDERHGVRDSDLLPETEPDMSSHQRICIDLRPRLLHRRVDVPRARILRARRARDLRDNAGNIDKHDKHTAGSPVRVGRGRS